MLSSTRSRSARDTVLGGQEGYAETRVLPELLTIYHSFEEPAVDDLDSRNLQRPR